jgi:[ribosomal protein S18]-alanine N-acetyltransferase
LKGKRKTVIEIIRACKEHIDEITAIERICFRIPWSRESIREEIEDNNLAIYLCAKTDGKIAGYAGYWKVTDEAHITNIAVHPEYRRNGIGSILVKGMIETCRKTGIDRMTLEVRKSNVEAQGLYKKFGFKFAGIRKAYYSDNKEDAVIMWNEI